MAKRMYCWHTGLGLNALENGDCPECGKYGRAHREIPADQCGRFVECTDPIIAGRPPRVELIQPADNPEPLPLPETAQAPNRQPTIWLLIALAFVVWAVCMLGGCES